MAGKLFGITGFKNSGKDSIGKILISNYEFCKDSFANPLKDACSAIFGWPRYMLEGETEESREWREQVDEWWSNKLEFPEFSPRKALQYIGTDVFRQKFCSDIWLLSFENRFTKSNKNIVITDCRFQNELNLIKFLNGTVIQVIRGPKPNWWELAAEVNISNDFDKIDILEKELKIHPSEYSWVGFPADFYIENNGTKFDLELQVIKIMENSI
ncbi:MAG: hypothetical protein HC836_23135 [Richelia sp. RM2_1_2]|nr:hypothetical protein [Richelia sp. RM2_1_2]